MEIILQRASSQSAQVSVLCDGQPSHHFDLRAVLPDSDRADRPPHPLQDPAAYGRALFAALFAEGSAARRAWEAGPARVLLVATEPAIQAVPWEFAHGPHGFLVTEAAFVRGLPAAERVPPPALGGGLHLVAVPANPLDDSVHALNIEGEWMRLAEALAGVPQAVTLERVRPPTVEGLRAAVAGQTGRVVHFMGHGGQHASGAVLCFEDEAGGLQPATAREFVQRVRGATFLVTLNACVSATPGETEFANLAAALVAQKIPYALGMRFVIADEDALKFARAFYSDLARGAPVAGVTWYEAVAYCAWLTARLRQSDETVAEVKRLLARVPDPKAFVFRLPREAEWQTAAGGVWRDAEIEKRTARYPWQIEPGTTTRDDIQRCANTGESALRQTTPVCLYPVGASQPYSVMDLAGNVWEWQVNSWDKDRASFAIRGGAWNRGMDNARVAFRGWYSPRYDWGDLGFRVVAAPVSR